MIFQRLSYSMITPAELAQSVTSYLQSLPETEGLNPMITLLKTVLDRDLKALNKAITAVRHNDMVDDVADADGVRDDDFLTFRDTVMAQKRKKDPEIKAAYELIWAVIEKAGTRLHVLGYTEESGKLNALFEELDEPEKQSAMDTLNVMALYNELKASQKDFEDVFSSKLSADQAKNYPTLKDAKGRILPHLSTLYGVLEVLAEEQDAYALASVSAFNGITATVMSTARARKTRGENGEDAPEEMEQ